MVHIQSPSFETEAECPLVPWSDFLIRLSRILPVRQGYGSAGAKINEPLSNMAFDQLPDEEKMQYLELAGILSRFRTQTRAI